MTSPIPIFIVAEDFLASCFATILVQACGSKFYPTTLYEDGGFGFIRKNAVKYNRAALIHPFLIITDLDSCVCPTKLIREYLNKNEKSDKLIFRVAQREVESWIMGDGEKLAEFFGISSSLIPSQPEQIIDPKSKIIELAKKSKKARIKVGMIPRGNAKQGPDHNGLLKEFLQKSWRFEKACTVTPSLKRAFKALQNF